jgi:hypothetical protein
MCEDDKIKIIAISKETFDKLSEDKIQHLKESILNRFQEAEDVKIIMLPREEIFNRYIEKKEPKDARVVVILDDKDEKERFEKSQEEFINKVMEFTMPPHLPEMLDSEYIYQEQKKQQKPFVPRTIGKPNSKKKGGR